MLLKNQRAVFNNADLGYKPSNKQRTIENLFVKFTPKIQKLTICYCCGKNEYKSYICNDRLITHSNKVEIKVKSSIPSMTKKVT